MPQDRDPYPRRGSRCTCSTTSTPTGASGTVSSLALALLAAGTLFAWAVLAPGLILLSTFCPRRTTSAITAGAAPTIPLRFGAQHTNGYTRKEIR